MKYITLTITVLTLLMSCNTPTESEEKDSSIIGQWGYLKQIEANNDSVFYGFNFNVNDSIHYLKAECEFNRVKSYVREYTYTIIDDSTLLYNWDTLWYKLDNDTLYLEQGSDTLPLMRNVSLEQCISVDTSREKFPVGYIDSDSIIHGTWTKIGDDHTMYRFAEEDTYLVLFEYNASLHSVDSSIIFDYSFLRDSDTGILYWVFHLGAAHAEGTYNLNPTLDTMKTSHLSPTVSVFIPDSTGAFPEEWDVFSE